MSKPSDVVKVGTDSSGRAIYMTRYMQGVWAQILADPAVAPFAGLVTIVQGAFMARNGGGASDSAGYHDGGGCLDIRTWNLSAAQLEAFIRTSRRYGFPFWRRDASHGGMDPHAHGVLGTDYALAGGARAQWGQYLEGRDGLASNGRDYEWRPSPLVKTPPEDDMFNDADRTLLTETRDAALKAAKESAQARVGSYRRDQKLKAKLRAVGIDAAKVDKVLAELDDEG